MSSPKVYRYDSWVKSVIGNAVPGAQIYVCLQPANTDSAPPTPLATIYSDRNGLVPITQPILTDGFGHASFYARAGVYTVVVANGGVIQQLQTLPDQSLGGIATNTNGGGSSGGTALVLQTNSVSNGDQLLLNLVSGANVTISDDGLGSVTIASVEQPLSGYIVGPNLGFPQVSGGSGNLATNNNQVRVALFYLPTSITISRAVIQVSGGSNGTNFSVGIYRSNGVKVVDSGVFTVSGTGNQSSTFAPVTLAAGFYYYSQTADNFVGVQLTSVSLGTTTLAGLLNTGLTVYGNGSTPSVGGALPSTLGSIVAENGAAMSVAMAVFC